MTELELFNFNGSAVRVILDSQGDPWFIASDACEVLGYSRTADAMRLLTADDLATHVLRGNDQEEHLTQIISLGGLYDLVMGSRRPEAKAFRRWVTHEVLPAIHRTGSYGVPAQRPAIPQSYTEAVRELLASLEATDEARQKQVAAEAHAAELAPRAALADRVIDADGDWSVRETALILSRDPDIDIGQNQLFDYLRDLGWIDRANLPYRHQVHCGRLTSKEQSYNHPRQVGVRRQAKPQVRVTGKGMAELHRLLNGGTALGELLEAAGPVDAQGPLL